MDYSLLLRQSWQITLSTRVLWPFGFVLALMGGSNNSPLNLLDLVQRGINPLDLPFFLVFLEEWLAGIVTLALGWLLVGVILRPITTISIISLEQHQFEGESINWRLGWRKGWSVAAWRLFLIELIVRLSISIFFLILLMFSLAPLLLLLIDMTPLQVLAGLITFAFSCLWFLFYLASSFFIAPFIELCRRFVVLAHIGPIKSIRFSYNLLKRRWPSFIRATVIIFILNLVWTVGSTIPLLGFGGLGLFSQFALDTFSGSSGSENIIGVFSVIGGGGLILLGVLTWLYLTGLFLIFQLTFWSQVFRELNVTAY